MRSVLPLLRSVQALSVQPSAQLCAQQAVVGMAEAWATSTASSCMVSQVCLPLELAQQVREMEAQARVRAKAEVGFR